MKTYKFIDFGSTFTKLTLVDIEKEEIVATAKSYTTVGRDVKYGYEKALEELNAKVGHDYEVVKTLACSSAAGGLKMISIGLVPDLTAEAAKRAALGAGARVINNFAFKLNSDEFEEIALSNADIILLAGGTDGGNTETIIHNARGLVEHDVKIPIVVAGNKSTHDEIKKIFAGRNNLYFTENVMPKINEINVEPARETIREIFMQNITKAKGMRNVETEISSVAMPTPQSVLKAAEALSKGTNNEEGIGDLIIVDVGGATTDVHTICWGDPTKPGVFTIGLEEPFAKRTVEGDLGMRYSAMSVYEASGMRMLRKYLDVSQYENPKIEYLKRYEKTSFVSTTEKDIKFDEAMAKICIDLSVKRHAGVVEPVYSTSGIVYSQRGKDLSEIKYLIGTGGIIVNSENYADLLSAATFRPDDLNSLKPRFPNYYVDKRYILSAMGLLTMIDKDMAVRIMKKYILDTKVENTFIPED
ncbi:MAG: methylaspartate mutase accessory protein GlmL [Ezakiella sp.]|nr:methylaspartate mutase accessory protein GlmL [Ezakiella sp.]MDD7471267.1 methylaspartate mutase accessory protein GlmL [Bacillota bacterium]MDY3923656.1 methylaspartate mutase accessory protein GlmL [Ezakiella sp.]